MLNEIVVFIFQLRNVDDIIYFIRAIGDRIYGFVFLDLGCTLPQGETNRCPYMNRTSLKFFLTSYRLSGVDRHHFKIILLRLIT